MRRFDFKTAKGLTERPNRIYSEKEKADISSAFFHIFNEKIGHCNNAYYDAVIRLYLHFKGKKR